MAQELATLRRDARRGAIAAAVSAAVLGCSGPGLAQNYPSNVVKVVVPFPGGGPLDFSARLLAEKLSARFKQPFVIDNRPGAAGNIGTEAVAKAAPDGHTLLLVLDTPLTVNPAVYKNYHSVRRRTSSLFRSWRHSRKCWSSIPRCP